MKKLSLLILALFATACAHPQVPAGSVHAVTLTWNAPVATAPWTGCSTADPCVYAVYRCVGTASTCPAVPTSSTSWTEITTPATRPSATTYVDLNVVAADTYTYVVETVQATLNSGPSNTTTATVPNTGIPTAPAVGNPTTATGTVPLKPGIPAATLRDAVAWAWAGAPTNLKVWENKSPLRQ